MNQISKSEVFQKYHRFLANVVGGQQLWEFAQLFQMEEIIVFHLSYLHTTF